ncbi:hypothetical protein [Neisseria sicca]|nr:hypothetical protein [Neisseria sicca]
MSRCIRHGSLIDQTKGRLKTWKQVSDDLSFDMLDSINPVCHPHADG